MSLSLSTSLSNKIFQIIIFIIFITFVVHIASVIYYTIMIDDNGIIDIHKMISNDSFDDFVSLKNTISSSLSTCCHTMKYENIGKIINCSTHKSDIGVLSMYVQNEEAIKKKKSRPLDANGILNNHLSYIIKNQYTYFKIDSLNFTKPIQTNKFHLESKKLWAAKKLQILLSKLEIIIKVLMDYKNEMKYLLWIDFDVLFFNCSTKIEFGIIEKSKYLYNRKDKSAANLIFAFNPTSIINSGVVLYKNTKWTLLFLKKMIKMSKQFASVINEVHRGWGDQNIFISILMGYNYNNSYNETDKYLKYLRKDPCYENKRGTPNETWKWLGDNQQSLYLYNKLNKNIQKHVSLLSPFDMNLGFKYYRNDISSSNFPYQPFIVHFAGPPSKPYVWNSGTQRKSFIFPKCVNKLKVASFLNNKNRTNETINFCVNHNYSYSYSKSI